MFKKFIHLAFVHQTEWGQRFFLLPFLFILYHCNKKNILNGVQFQSIKPSFNFCCLSLRKKKNRRTQNTHSFHIWTIWNWKDIDFFVSRSVKHCTTKHQFFGFNSSIWMILLQIILLWKHLENCPLKFFCNTFIGIISNEFISIENVNRIIERTMDTIHSIRLKKCNDEMGNFQLISFIRTFYSF